MSRVQTLLSDLIRFESLSRSEAAIADYVETYARSHGLNTGRHGDNVYFWLGDGNHRLLLNSHLDVVPPSADHPFPPFEPTVSDGALYGRGSVDAKASGAAMTCALIELANSGWIPPAGGCVMTALTACEETGGDYNGLEDLLPHLGPIASAIVGEPTDMQPCVAQKGLLILEVTARGRSAHAARAHLGENALYVAARDLARVEHLAFERTHEHLGSVTATPTVIEGGAARNMVPDACTFTLDVRSTPAYTHDELSRFFSTVLEGDVTVRSDRIVPCATPDGAPILQAAVRSNAKAAPFGSPTASDWIFLTDIPTIKMGPGDSRLSHTAQERIPLSALPAAVAGYRDTIRAYFELMTDSDRARMAVGETTTAAPEQAHNAAP